MATICAKSVAYRLLRAETDEVEIEGELKPHHRFMLAEQLHHIDGLDAAIARLGQEIAAHMGAPEVAPQEHIPEAKAVQQQDPEAGSRAGSVGGNARLDVGARHRVALHDSGHQSTGCGSHPGRDRAEYGPLPKCEPPGILGRHVSGQPRECRQTREMGAGAKPVPGCASCSWRRLMRQPIPRTRICRPNTAGLLGALVPRRPWSPWGTPSW